MFLGPSGEAGPRGLELPLGRHAAAAPPLRGHPQPGWPRMRKARAWAWLLSADCLGLLLLLSQHLRLCQARGPSLLRSPWAEGLASPCWRQPDSAFPAPDPTRQPAAPRPRSVPRGTSCGQRPHS